MGNCAVFDKSIKLPTNEWKQLLNNSAYRGIGKNSSNQNKTALIKNADVSIFLLYLVGVNITTICYLVYFIMCCTLKCQWNGVLESVANIKGNVKNSYLAFNFVTFVVYFSIFYPFLI